MWWIINLFKNRNKKRPCKPVSNWITNFTVTMGKWELELVDLQLRYLQMNFFSILQFSSLHCPKLEPTTWPQSSASSQSSGWPSIQALKHQTMFGSPTQPYPSLNVHICSYTGEAIDVQTPYVLKKESHQSIPRSLLWCGHSGQSSRPLCWFVSSPTTGNDI